MSLANPNAGLDFSYITPTYARRQAELDRQHAQRHIALIADAKARGVTGLRCEQCHTLHGVGIIGSPCNADADGEGTPCGCWDLREVVSKEVAA